MSSAPSKVGQTLHQIEGTSGGQVTVDLINALIAEQAEGNTGKIIRQLTAQDCVIIDELGYIPFPKSGGSLLFHLISYDQY